MDVTRHPLLVLVELQGILIHLQFARQSIVPVTLLDGVMGDFSRIGLQRELEPKVFFFLFFTPAIASPVANIVSLPS